MIISKGLTFDDVLLVPGYNHIESRRDVSTAVELGPYKFNIPLISANMDTITGKDMAFTMGAVLGGLGIIHRFQTPDAQGREWDAAYASGQGYPVGVAVGVSDVEEVKRAEHLYSLGARLFCVDIAHAHSKLMRKQLQRLRDIPDIFIIAGNVACMVPETPVLTRDLRWIPVGNLKVGDKIMGFDEAPVGGKRRRWQEAEVTATGRKTAQLYKVTLATGEIFRVTGEHKWLVCDGNKQNRVWYRTDWMASRLSVRHRLRVCRLIKPWEDPPLSYPAGFLAGAFDGEGCLAVRSRKFGLSFAQKDNAMLEATREYLRGYGFRWRENIAKESNVVKLEILGGYNETLRFLAQFRPPRLMEKWLTTDISVLTTKVANDGERVDIIAIEPDGVGEIVELSSSSQTYLASGYGVHNTYSGADSLVGWGAHAIKVGIGAGSVCTTREKTGFGVPQLTAILDCAKVDVPIIADGGMRKPGDVVKALAAGATMVMLGGMLAGTDEAAGGKQYRGMASAEAQEDYFGSVADWKTAEGIAVTVQPRGPVEDIIKDVIGGLRSGLTYAGARNIAQLHHKANFIEVSQAAFVEGTPHYEATR